MTILESEKLRYIRMNLSDCKAQIDQALQELIAPFAIEHKILYDAASYSLFGGGKRLRPLLAIAVSNALGGKLEKILVPACALELIHTYSLIHDDLPGMDNDDYRRGKPTLHKVFSEGQAILTGDFLLTYAFDILGAASSLSAAEKLAMIQTLALHAGPHGMIGGQSLDLSSPPASHDDLKRLHEKKTGALIEASIHFGCIGASATPEVQETLSQFAKKFGLAFQILDDVIDVTNPKEKHGKEISSDITNKKLTYATVYGTENAKNTATGLLQEASDLLNNLPYNFHLLKNLTDSLTLKK